MTRHSILIGGSVLRTAATLALAASVAACSLTPEKGPDPRDRLPDSATAAISDLRP